MSYISKETAQKAVKKMKFFHDEVVSTYSRHGMDLLGNLGRRNIVMSQAQEKFFAQVLSEQYPDAREDGRTGQPDIVIESLGKELECKLTSRHKAGGISFHTDYQTLLQKGTLDYLYVIADPDFAAFAVLHFVGLTVDDFRPLSPGARGKVAMFKHKGMKKCRILVGDAETLNDVNLEKLKSRLSTEHRPAERRKIKKRINYWKTVPEKYRFNLSEVSSAAS
jgi:hypothetical protein